MAAFIVSDMQASPSPEASSHSLEPSPYHSDPWIADATRAVQFSQHDPQHQFPDDPSHLFSEQSAVGSNYGQLPQLASPTSSLPSQQANTPQRRETRRSVACQRCRDLKVRCDVVPGNPNCRRCLKRNRTCEMIEPKRKRAKKTEKAEQKISDLESRIHSLTQELAVAKAEILNGDGHSTFASNDLSHSTKFTHTPFPGYQAPIQYLNHARDPHGLYNLRASHAFEDHGTLSHKRMAFSYANQSPNTYQPLVPAEVVPYSAGQMDVNPYTMTVATPAAPDLRQTGNSVPIPGYADIQKRYIPDEVEVYKIFDHFARSMAPQIPIIVFPEYTHPVEIIATRPTLFLAILSIAAPLEIQAPLSSEVLRILGHSIIVDQEASLELIQALQVIIMWFWPIGGRDARCSQYCSIACTMAISLGMNTPSGNEEHWSLWSAKHPGESEEGARAYVGCFILGSMYVKRPHRLFVRPISW